MRKEIFYFCDKESEGYWEFQKCFGLFKVCVDIEVEYRFFFFMESGWEECVVKVRVDIYINNWRLYLIYDNRSCIWQLKK